MEAMSVEQRLERLENLAGITGPAICPDPTGEGSAWQGVPVIPLEDGFDGVHPDDAREGDEYWLADRWWKSGGGSTHPKDPSAYPWRRRKSPATAEPAPGSDAEHPPEGYRLEPVSGKRAPGYIWWDRSNQSWKSALTRCVGNTIVGTDPPIANPIPANEGDSQAEIAELRATVERLTAELDATKRILAESLVERDRLKNLHDARKVRIEGFRDVLRERLGDLV